MLPTSTYSMSNSNIRTQLCQVYIPSIKPQIPSIKKYTLVLIVIGQIEYIHTNFFKKKVRINETNLSSQKIIYSCLIV